MNNKQRARKKKQRAEKAKKRVLARRKNLRQEAKNEREIWLIKRNSEKEINRLTGTTYRKPKEISENTED
jgi:hypothetical protein